jgi:alpha-beta hydrolase superfamily lysophospholipase
MKKVAKGLGKLIIWLAILLAICMAIFHFGQDFLTFPGRGLYSSSAVEWQSRMSVLSAQGIVPIEFAAPAGQAVNGIWARGGVGANPAILWIHSRTKTTTEINEDIRPLNAAGFHVFAMEYRGYGKSVGEPSEANLLADAEASVDWMLARDDVAGRRVFVGGVELGANLALQLAARKPVDGVIAVSTLPDLATAVADKIPVVPLGFLLRDRFDVRPALNAVAAPVFFLHGTEDKVVPLPRIEELVARLAGRAQVLEVAGAGNENVIEKGGKDLVEAIENFKDRPK